MVGQHTNFSVKCLDVIKLAFSLHAEKSGKGGGFKALVNNNTFFCGFPNYVLK